MILLSRPLRRPRQSRPASWPAWTAAGGFGLAALICVPLAIEAGRLLTTEDDPVAITDRALPRAFGASVAVNGIENALTANDADLARSFVDLADDRLVTVPRELRQRVDAAVREANSAVTAATGFARGFITGESDNVASLAGTAIGDLLVFGDVRDVVREGNRYANDQKYDELVLGLACAGIALTVGTYASFGVATPVRVGLSAVKAARKTGRIGGQMASWIERSLRDAVDWNGLRGASFSVADPAIAVRAARQAVKVEKADGLAKLVGDIGRLQARAGAQAALDGLKLARTPAELTKVARLAEKKGGRTRAILKTLGRGAILLSVASFNLAMWILGALVMLFGLVSSAKAGVERMTLRHLACKRAQNRCRGPEVRRLVQA